MSGTGALFGVLLASWAVPVFVAGLGAVLPRAAEIRLDPAVLAFTAVLALATGLLFGALPAWNLPVPSYTAFSKRADGRAVARERAPAPCS